MPPEHGMDLAQLVQAVPDASGDRLAYSLAIIDVLARTAPEAEGSDQLTGDGIDLRLYAGSMADIVVAFGFFQVVLQLLQTALVCGCGLHVQPQTGLAYPGNV